MSRQTLDTRVRDVLLDAEMGNAGLVLAMQKYFGYEGAEASRFEVSQDGNAISAVSKALSRVHEHGSEPKPVEGYLFFKTPDESKLDMTKVPTDMVKAIQFRERSQMKVYKSFMDSEMGLYGFYWRAD